MKNAFPPENQICKITPDKKQILRKMKMVEDQNRCENVIYKIGVPPISTTETNTDS